MRQSCVEWISELSTQTAFNLLSKNFILAPKTHLHTCKSSQGLTHTDKHTHLHQSSGFFVIRMNNKPKNYNLSFFGVKNTFQVWWPSTGRVASPTKTWLIFHENSSRDCQPKIWCVSNLWNLVIEMSAQRKLLCVTHSSGLKRIM